MIEWSTATSALLHWLQKYNLGEAKIVLEFKSREVMNNAKNALDYELAKERKPLLTEYKKESVYPKINGFEIEFNINPGKPK